MRASVLLSLCVAFCLAACRRASTSESHASADRAAADPAIPARRAAHFPDGWSYPAGQAAARAPNGMIASDEPRATAAGVEILERGGNAIDAAVAVGFALAVTYQEAGNLGGGGYMVIRLADGRVAAIDYREVAPLAATRNMFLDSAGALTDRSLDGPLASGVPGSVAGLTTVLRSYGTMPLGQVMEPAIRLAEEGFLVDSSFRRSVLTDSARIAKFPVGAAIFLPGGRAPVVGSRFRQPALARTMRLIAARGADAFYRGEIADSIAAEMRRGGGIITREDLARYRPLWRTPIRSTYRGYTLFSMPPSSSGGVTVTETLNILERWDSLPPAGSAAWAHILGSAFQRAFIDRNSKLADPAFYPVPVSELTSKDYARRLRATIADRATPTPALERAMREGTQTTHYSVVDRAGNAVATTTTTNGLYGSGILVRGGGFYLNNEMDDLSAQPGTANQFGLVQGEANAVAPGKRPLSAMSPTIVLDPSGSLLLVVGSRGGPRIITSTAQVILNVIDRRMSLADAMAAPRLHHQALPDTLRYEPGGMPRAVRDSLTAIGHAVGEIDHVGLVNAVMRVPGAWEGVSDPRRPGGVKGP
ncbi:MAG: gamma-glutamyltransferase [Gemmatimonadota bacterium]|nr:gamma-glutamyltransferase [Gemmatimonadota bacterium]